jgi:hypothetical protein
MIWSIYFFSEKSFQLASGKYEKHKIRDFKVCEHILIELLTICFM